ncbi:hypothetical protein BpHYR1_053588 [Brachionus plicatilis]|uniref:Uncharacterized protein n=1 Tax=Brachionus plicatilis TaxID=10195 RepID=A0A3M7QTW6_BRAPC|nr:hypothetical protein BpHYR1_053588 [Brachionus plicatilis]
MAKVYQIFCQPIFSYGLDMCYISKSKLNTYEIFGIFNYLSDYYAANKCPEKSFVKQIKDVNIIIKNVQNLKNRNLNGIKCRSHVEHGPLNFNKYLSFIYFIFELIIKFQNYLFNFTLMLRTKCYTIKYIHCHKKKE